MSDDSPVKKRLECSVCLETYDTTHRLPRALRCQHTFCASCVDTLANKPELACPKCRQVTPKAEVITNFALMEIVETLCGLCEMRETNVRCQHCNRDLCGVCDDEHIEVIKEDTSKAMEDLSEKLVLLTRITTDTNILKMESERSEQAKAKLMQDLRIKRKALDDYEQETVDKFDDIMDDNVHTHSIWREEVDMKLSSARSFIQNAERKILRKTINKAMLIEIQKNSEKFLGALDASNKDRPAMKPFPEEIPRDIVEIPKGLFSAEESSRYKVITKFANGLVDFTSVKFKRMVGSKGTGPDEFGYAGAIAVIAPDDFLAVTDFYNNRVKVFDKYLKLLFMIGKTGSGFMEFNDLPGISINNNNEIFVSDGDNNRIQVFSKYGQFLRCFGRSGSGAGQLRRPAGTASNNAGLLYVCDAHNYRIQVFMYEGKFVRMFGSRGDRPEQFANKPVYIVVARRGHLLVAEFKGMVKMFYQDGRYIKTIPHGMPKSFGEVQCNGIAEDQFRNIIIVDESRLLVLRENGDFVCSIGQEGSAPGEFYVPDGVAVTGSGDIAVCDGHNHRVQVLEVCRRWDRVALS